MLAAVALQVSSLPTQLGLHLAAFFMTALLGHAELARRRPDVARLTEFYLCMSLGGALGGTVNALAAPVLFSGPYEYELALVAACALRVLMLTGAGAGVSRGWRASDLWVPAALVRDATEWLHQERNFFGAHRVVLTQDGERIALLHRHTMHGMQMRDPARKTEPLGYYSTLGPAGQVFAALTAARAVGVVGLGAGAQACLARPGQSVTFFEIDRVMARIAWDDRWFSYLSRCAPGAEIRIGDGRLALAGWQGPLFDLLVVDAFSSDAIPMHLLTREAVALYLDRLEPHGVLLLHVSNLYLMPVVAAAVERLGAAGLAQLYVPDAAAAARGAGASHWIVVARDAAALAPLAGDGRWQALRAPAGQRAWTHDFSDLLGTLKRD